MRHFVKISFDGTDFFGWQVQPDKQTIQGEINTILSKILQENIHVVGCGRTDTGVHASEYYLHFDCTKELPSELKYKMNQMLSNSIVVQEVFKVESKQHSRYDATKRSYTYHLHLQNDPFKNRYSTYCFYKDLDIQAMQSVAKSLMNYTDFEALSKTAEEQNHSLCTIFSSELIYVREENRLEYQVTANRFLHNMIRRIIGLLINVGRGKITPNEVELVLREKRQFRQNTVSPPQGLFLSNVEYSYIKKEPQ